MKVLTYTVSFILLILLCSPRVRCQHPGLSEWDLHQVALREKVLSQKGNDILKGSFLEEIYIRSVVTAANDSLFVTIPFDLHSPFDCGAPDCYTTEVSFSFKLGNKLVLPQTIGFSEHEYGCVEYETRLSGTFLLREQSDRYVIYHSPGQKRTLVLFSRYNDVHTCAYYFVDVDERAVSAENLFSIVKQYDEDDTSGVYPLQSTMLSTNEYERFLSKN